MWTTREAIELCKHLETKLSKYGVHVALTGGLLYKEGPRKDCDIVLYNGRNGATDYGGIREELKEFGLEFIADHGFVEKWRTPDDRYIDFLYPDFGGSYGP